jgi:hypothetical protein
MKPRQVHPWRRHEGSQPCHQTRMQRESGCIGRTMTIALLLGLRLSGRHRLQREQLLPSAWNHGHAMRVAG